MGIKGLWEILDTVAQERSSAEFAAFKLSNWTKNGRQHAIIGVDVSDLIWAAQASREHARARGASRASTGKNSELQLVMKQIAWLVSTFSAQVLVFVFDGPDRPSLKWGKRVGVRDHWMVHDVQRLVRAFGCYVHMAPGEAEAELAYLNKIGVLDFVFTSDSDVFVFGAVNVIRSAQKTENHDAVQIYTRQNLESYEKGPLNCSAFLFMALTMGGNYDPRGLPGCGKAMASSLCHSELAWELEVTIQLSLRHTMRSRLSQWRSDLWKTFAKDPNGRLGRRAPKIAASITHSFPPIDTAVHYAKPVTSGTDHAFAPDLTSWVQSLPDTRALCELAWELFNDRDIVKFCQDSVWECYCIRQLSLIDPATSLPVDQGFGQRLMESVKRAKKFNATSPTSFMCYKTRFSIRSSVLSTATQFPVEKNHWSTCPPEIALRNSLYDVWVLAPVLERVAPEKIDRYNKSRGSESGPPASLQPYIPPVVTFSNAKQALLDANEKHGKAPATRESYTGHVEQAQQFIQTLAMDEEEMASTWEKHKERLGYDQEEDDGNVTTGAATSSSSKEEDSDNDDTAADYMDPELPKSLDGAPIKSTPFAVALFMSHKCFGEDLGISPTHGIHAALLDHYNRLRGDKYRGQWHYDHRSKKWVGNPCHSAIVQDTYCACKKKDGEPERRHSRAMRIEDMQKIHEHLQHNYPKLEEVVDADSAARRVTMLHYMALSTVSWAVWTQSNEIINLQMKHLDFNPPPPPTDTTQFFERYRGRALTINLQNRKNWQRKLEKGEHQLNGHLYYIYSQPDNPAVDTYNHLVQWLNYYEKLKGRPLEPDDYVFPTLSVNHVHPSRPVSAPCIKTLINNIATEAKVSGAGHFATHCFRRGGSQYRFMYAPLQK
ncbi:hypothetical protein EST38_g4935 [Candolleomyces aberdarensis]|uniref:XPG-I domain-containing protein n=1 Tax=Candolleomyces aberdarensis TaxID=2316362 RepID=A0A4Q2DLQ2_9AGAR|nr:hypothetical protein EST38_g4935 [Candolleomyces aberdarensis]